MSQSICNSSTPSIAQPSHPTYTDSQYPLQYYFELRQGPESAWLYPGFADNLTGQPYFVVAHALGVPVHNHVNASPLPKITVSISMRPSPPSTLETRACRSIWLALVLRPSNKRAGWTRQSV